MPLNFFGKKGNKSADVDYKARLEHKLYLARENPEPVFDIADCALKVVPAGVYSLCRVFRKEALYLQENSLTSLGGGGSLVDLSLLHILDLHSNCFVQLPNEIGLLKSLRVLNVSHNQLKQLPESIGNLGTLQILNASFNKLRAVPDSFGGLRRIQTIDLRNNRYLRVLPDALGRAATLKELLIDPDGFIYPPQEVAKLGTPDIMQFLAEKLSVEYISPADAEEEREENEQSSVSYADWEEKDKNFQDQKQQELLALEKDLEEHQKKELQVQNAMKSNKGRLLEDLVEQQNKLENEIFRIQHDREVERQRLIEQILEVERTADSVVSNLLALTALRDTQQLQELVEQEQEEERRLLNLAQYEYQSYRRKDVINAMESLLEEECRREQKLREYEEGRAEISRTLLGQQVESDRQLEEMICTQGQAQTDLVARLHKDEELQRAAVGALLERSDARSWGLVQQVALVESQLAALTAVEMERKKLEMDEQVVELSEKRMALSLLLLDLLSQQAERRQQLINTLIEMERRRWVDEEGENKDGDFWLRQYQRLLDSRPSNLIEMEQTLDPLLAHHLVLAGAIHCLPFLVRWVNSLDALRSVNEAALIDAGLTRAEDRLAILNAVRVYLEEKSAHAEKLDERPEPTAPPLSPEDEAEPNTTSLHIAECVICMEEKCEVIFVPCGHMCSCIKCAEKVADCPMCRSNIDKKIRVMLP